MNKYMGLAIVLAVIALSLIMSSYILAEKKVIVRNVNEDTVVQGESAYEKCFTVLSNTSWLLSIRVNATTNYTLYSLNTIITRKVLQANGSYLFKYRTVDTTEYCILLLPLENTRIIYNMSFLREELVEPYGSLFSITGILFLLISLGLGYYSLATKSSEYPPIIKGEGIECRSKSLNKHECILSIMDRGNYRDLVGTIKKVYTHILGYREKKGLGENILVFHKKGSLFTREYEKKPRTVIVSILENKVLIEYIFSTLSAGGSIDLKGVFNEVRQLYSLITKNT